jgi:hypothetical protein
MQFFFRQFSIIFSIKFISDIAQIFSLLPSYVIILEAGVNSHPGKERSCVTLTIINKLWEPQHYLKFWNPDIACNNDSYWRIRDMIMSNIADQNFW